MHLEEPFDLLLQPFADTSGHSGEVQRGRRVLGELKQPALDTGEAVLQTEIEDGSPDGGQTPDRLPFRNAQAEPEGQPAFPHLGGACQDVQPLGQQPLHHELVGGQRCGEQGIGVYGFQLLHEITPFEIVTDRLIFEGFQCSIFLDFLQ